MSLDSILIGVLVVLSFALFLTSVVSYRRSRETKMAIVALAFFLILIKAFIWIVALAFAYMDVSTTFTFLAVMDVAVLVSFFAATLKPS